MTAVIVELAGAMLPENPFLQLTLPRVVRSLARRRRGKVRLRLAKGLSAYQTDLSEETKDKRPIRDIRVSPYELISVRIR